MKGNVFVSEEVIKDIQRRPDMSALQGNFRTVANKVREMLSMSAPITSPEGNCRYMEYVFDYRRGKVLRVSMVDRAPRHLGCCIHCQGTKKIIVYNECLYCNGWAANNSCKYCDDGWIKEHIPCQDCK